MSAYLKILLQLIKVNADSSFLLKQGLSYSQISSLFGEALQKELIAHEGNEFNLTQQGKKFLAESKSLDVSEKSGNWIYPDESRVIPKISKEEIYLPKLKDSKFLDSDTRPRAQARNGDSPF